MKTWYVEVEKKEFRYFKYFKLRIFARLFARHMVRKTGKIVYYGQI
jgi:hypothetical protein